MDLRMKIERNISTRTITSIKITIPSTLEALETLEYTFWTIPETMEAKISRDTQLETPCSVISSPNRIKRMDPMVIVRAVMITFGRVVEITLPPRR
jgi:hypothetical protein